MPYLIVQEGALKGLTFQFETGEEWVIGRSPTEADFIIDDSTVSRRQARIIKKPDGSFLLKNLSRTNPTLLNGQPVSGSAPIQKGDRIQIGPSTFTFFDESLPQAEAPPPAAKNGYDEIFGNLENPDLPPEPEPVEPLPTQEPPSPQPDPVKTAYDTIFEDTGGEGEPFNLLSIDAPLLLKVIAGPNAGAEIGLEKDRTYTIGKDSASCDIVFQDLSVSRHHAKLSISADGILELEDLSSKNGTVVNGVALTEKRIITTRDLIAMGTTIFLIIDREASQETIFSSLLPSYEMPKPPEEPKETTAEGTSEPELTDWKTKKLPLKHLIAALSFAAIFLIIFLSFFSLFKAQPIELVHKAPHETIKEAVSKFPDVQYAFNATGGNLFLTGHVLTAVEFQELHYNLNQIPAIHNIEDTVVIDEGVSKIMNDLLNESGAFPSVSIAAAEPGRFVVHGIVQTSEQAALLSDYLTANFPYLDRLQNNVVSQDILSTQVGSMLIADGFGAVAFQMINGDLLLSGRYSANKEKEFDAFLKKAGRLAGVQSVKNFAVATSPQSAAVDLTQQYKVTGNAKQDNHGYSAVINGTIYTVNQSLDGMKITMIDRNAILLEKDGLNYKINYTP